MDKPKPLVYTAGPISSDPLGNLRRALRVYSRLVRDDVVVPFCPHLGALLDVQRTVPYEEWLRYDMAVIEHSQALLRLPGDSPGADREVAFAEELGIPVFHSVDELYAWATKSRRKRSKAMAR